MNGIRVCVFMCPASLLSFVFVIFMNVVACACSLFVSVCCTENSCVDISQSFVHGIVGGPLDDVSGGIIYKVATIVLISWWHIFLFGVAPGQELLSHKLCVSSASADNTELFSKVFVPIHSRQQHVGIPLVPHPRQHGNFNHAEGFVVTANCRVSLLFSLTDDVEHFCMCIGHLRYFVIWLLKSLAHFSIALSFSYWFVSIFNIR